MRHGCGNDMEEWLIWLIGGRRKHRQVAHEWLNQSAVDKYSAILEFEAAVMIKSLLDESGGGSMPLNPQVRMGADHFDPPSKLTGVVS